MKTHPSRRRSGFTLVELLVVITIVAVLAGVGFSAANNALTKTRTLTALTMATSLEQAVKQFYVDYSVLPVDSSGSEDMAPIRTDNDELLVVLLGRDERTRPALNSRGIQYLEVKEGKRAGTAGRDGLVYSENGESVIGLFDFWGNPFHVVLDTNYDGTIQVNLGGTRPQQRLNGRKVAVYSAGADKQLGTVDDVTTW